MTTTPITTAFAWAVALDAVTMDRTVVDVVSEGYAAGAVAGVALSMTDERIDDERGVLVSGDGAMVVRYDPYLHEWLPVSG